MSNNSTFNPEILNPQTHEEREFLKSGHLEKSARVPRVRELIGLSLQAGDGPNIEPELAKRWQLLRKDIIALSSYLDFFDDSPGNELKILGEFAQLPEIRRLNGERLDDGKFYPRRMQANPSYFIRWFINNRVEALRHSHNVATRKTRLAE
ncbi:hypothetical protein DRE_00721 [Drechslerella stenobrocha 248]|uniref:Uncharacterized protein n=1 Tax=Drechslerella stenobrocha 248 TaxID=1043628 RepID=W7HYQ4_9PEZI|nr:hypothetical protein DRE_00721 [Drechslerella stenobrocha 248]